MGRETCRNTSLKLKGKGTGVVQLGDGELSFPDADGSANQVLKTNGSGALSFTTPASGGAWSLIASSTYPAAVTWTLAGMDSTYDVYCFSFSGVTIANDNNSIFLRVGDSGGIKTDANYNYNISKNGTVGATHDAGVGTSDTKAGPLFNDAGNAAGENGSGVLWIHRTGNNCNINGTITYQKATPIIQTGYCGIWYNASSFAVTQVQLLSTTGNFTSGRMTLWGIAHA